jgi:signal transduction histidine kinase/DNA-binding NarL/FixJ family response regulator
MFTHVKRLFERYRSYHDMDRPMLQWIGVVGATAFPLFYLLRRTSIVPPRYDDFELRAVATVLCIGLALRRWWPTALKPFFFAYSYAVVFYCLSFLLAFTSLMNQGGTLSVVNMVMATILIMLLADWRNAVLMLGAGYAASVLAFLVTEPGSDIPSGFSAGAVSSILVVVAGALSHYGQQRAELQRMRRVYAGLAGSIAHEMRNPLAQVRHSLDSIARTLTPAHPNEGTRLAPEQVKTVLSTVEQGRDAISRGLQAIDLALQQLQPAPLDSGRLQPVQALACVQRAVRTYAYQEDAERAIVQLDARGDFRIRGDATALELVIFNLLKNALYYLPTHPDMTVTVTVAAEPGPRIVVRDTGPGIAPEQLPRLFEEFHTVGKAEGTGLGLAFCRRVMQALGGSIACRSVPGSFTEFTLSFPVLAADEAEAAPEPATASLAGRTVLVVDDQAMNRSAAGALCTAMGLRVLEADHGQQALGMLRAGTVPDVILMDMSMPGLDGLQTTRALRALPGPAGRVPVVALTANDSISVRQEAAAAGMQETLGKPVDGELLRRTLARLIAPEAASATAAADEGHAKTVPSSGLLDTERIEDFRRLGLMKDLLPDSLTGMRRLVQELQDCTVAGNAEGTRMALHTLVGVSGEVGARALHNLLRRRYHELLESRPPEGAGWIEEVRALLASTEEAFLRQYGVVAAMPTQTSSHSLRV